MSPGPPGSVTIVAGATGKLGRAIVARLLDGGHAVIGVSRGRAEALAGAPPAFEACRADLRDDGCTTALRAAIAGRPVAAVVNAAGAAQRGDVVEVQPEAIGALVDLKVGGLLRLVRAADPWLVDGSRIVALGGRLGYDADHRAAAAGVANAAVANLVRQLAQAYGPRGVTAHVIAPGAVAARDRGDRPATLTSDQDPATLSPIGRLPSPADVGWAVAMLLEPAASFLNGGALILDGGRRSGQP